MKTTTKQGIKSGIRAGALTSNHNEKLVTPVVRAKKLVIKSGVSAGRPTITANHNEKLVTPVVRAKKLVIKSGVSAGRIPGINTNHNEKLVRGKKVAIKSGVRAGHLTLNHNETLVRR